MRRYLFVLVIAGAVMASCMKSKENPCQFDPCAAKAPQSEITQLKSYLEAEQITAVEHCSGVHYKIIAQGTGDTPEICSAIRFNYKGTLTDGSVFDETTAGPVSFYLFELIPGWQNTLPMVKEGGKIQLFIPPSLGYGSAPQDGIPANSILIFEVEIVDVQ